jgi:hypothetical protein
VKEHSVSPKALPDQRVHPEATGGLLTGRTGWRWNEPDHGEHFRRCSHCGSIYPDDLLAEPQWTAQWTEHPRGWPHKFSVEIANRTPEALFVISASHCDHDGRYLSAAELTDEQRVVAERDGWLREEDPWTHLLFGTRPTHNAEFHTMHLRDGGISLDTKLEIERRSGLAFNFDGGRVRWWRWGAPCPSTVVAGLLL